jgi:polar amino acid transport system substrate-binding protein
MDKVCLVADPYPPYQYLEGAKVVGLDCELIRAAFQVQGFETEISLHPWEECLRIMEEGGADGLFQIQPTPEREKEFLFSDLLRRARTVFLENSGQPVDLTALGGLSQVAKRYSLGLVQGYSYDPEVDALPDERKTFFNGQEELLDGLSRGQVDLALMDQGVAGFLARKLGLDNIRPTRGFEVERNLHLAFRKDLKDLAELFNSGLARLEETGERQRIYI